MLIRCLGDTTLYIGIYLFIVSGKEIWAAVNETDIECTANTLRDFHACVHQHDDRDLTCVQAHYANAVGNNEFSIDWEPNFAANNLVKGRPLLSMASEELERSKSPWFDVLKSAVNKVMSSRQAVLHQESGLDLTSIRIDTSTDKDAKKLERFYGIFKNSQCESFRSLMLPYTVFKVPGTGSFTKNGMIPSKVLMGDGVETLLELIIPLELANEDPENPVMKLDTSTRMNSDLGSVLHAIPFYLVGEGTDGDIFEVWDIFTHLSPRKLNKPFTIDLLSIFRYSGVWIRKDWSPLLVNWLLTGGLACELDVVAKSPFHRFAWKLQPNLLRLYSRDKLICLRNCIKGFYILLLPQNFPNLEATLAASKLSAIDVCKFIPSAYEQSFGVMNKNPLFKKFSTCDHYTRSGMPAGKGILKEFDKVFYAYELSLCTVIWDKIALETRNSGNIEADLVIRDDPENDSCDDIPDIDPDDFNSFKEILSAFPVMNKDQVVERWISAAPTKAYSLLQRSHKDGNDPEKFRFGTRNRARLFQTNLEDKMEIPNMLMKRPNRKRSYNSYSYK